MSSEYDGMTTSELLGIVRETWIEYDLKQAIGGAPPDEDYIGAHIIDCVVYATPGEEAPAASPSARAVMFPKRNYIHHKPNG